MWKEFYGLHEKRFGLRFWWNGYCLLNQHGNELDIWCWNSVIMHADHGRKKFVFQQCKLNWSNQMIKYMMFTTYISTPLMHVLFLLFSLCFCAMAKPNARATFAAWRTHFEFFSTFTRKNAGNKIKQQNIKFNVQIKKTDWIKITGERINLIELSVLILNFIFFWFCEMKTRMGNDFAMNGFYYARQTRTGTHTHLILQSTQLMGCSCFDLYAFYIWITNLVLIDRLEIVCTWNFICNEIAQSSQRLFG